MNKTEQVYWNAGLGRWNTGTVDEDYGWRGGGEGTMDEDHWWRGGGES